MSKVGCLSKVTSLTRKLSGGGVTQNTKLYTDALIVTFTKSSDKKLVTQSQDFPQITEKICFLVGGAESDFQRLRVLSFDPQ